MKNVKIIVSGRTGGAQIVSGVSNDTNVVQFLKDNNSFGSSIAIGGTAVNDTHTFGDFDGDVIKIGVSGNVKPVGHADSITTEEGDENSDDEEEGGDTPSSFLSTLNAEQLDELYSIKNVARFFSEEDMKQLLVKYIDLHEKDNHDLKTFFSQIREEKTLRLDAIRANVIVYKKNIFGDMRINGRERIVSTLAGSYGSPASECYANGKKVPSHYIIQEGDEIVIRAIGTQENDTDMPF